MKRIIVVCLALVLMLIPIMSVNCDSDGNGNGNGDSTEVMFPDANLEAAIRQAIGKSEGAIYTSDLERLTILDASEKVIDDLTGLEYCTGLLELNLSHNSGFDDISPLENLTSLTYLDLEENYIRDISLLQNLTNLTELNLSCNYDMVDISPLQNLTSLTYLDFEENNINDISPLQNLTNLTYLNLGSNEDIRDISPLQNLTNLTELYLQWSEISDISPLQNLTNLIELDLGFNYNIVDISPLENLTKLEKLFLSYNYNIVDISLVQNLANLTDLDLSGYQNIVDMTLFQNLTSLTYLDLDTNNISDIAPLQNLTNLTFLDLWWNQIIDISPLENLTNLTELRIGNNQINDIEPLVNNTGFSDGDYLDLMDNPLSSESINIYIPQLEARGVTVEYEVTSEVTWRLATSIPGYARTEIFEDFAEKVFDKSDGRMEIEIFPGGTLYSGPEIFDAVSAGAIDIGSCPMAYYFAGMPKTVTTLSNIWSLDIGELAAARKALVAEFYPVTAEAENNNVMHLLWISGDYVEFYFDEPITEMADIAGLNIGCPVGPVSEILNIMGATPKTTQIADIYWAAETGVIDGAVLPLEDFANMQLQEVLPYVVITNILSPTYLTLINTDSYNNLTADLQRVVMEAAAEAEIMGFEALVTSHAERLAIMEADPDITIYTLTEAQQQDWWEIAFNPVFQSRIEDLLGDELATAQQIAADAIAAYNAS